MSNGIEFQQEMVRFPARYIDAVGLKNAIGRKVYEGESISYFDDYLNDQSVTVNEQGDVDIRFGYGGYTWREFENVCSFLNRFIFHPFTVVFKICDPGASGPDLWVFIPITFKPGGDGKVCHSVLVVDECGNELGVESRLQDRTGWNGTVYVRQDSTGCWMPYCFPTQPDITVTIWDRIVSFHHDGGFTLHEFLQTLDHWAATQEFGDHVLVEHIESKDRVNYTVDLESYLT